MRRCAALAARRLRNAEACEQAYQPTIACSSSRQYAVAAQASSSKQQSVRPADCCDCRSPEAALVVLIAV